MTIARRGRRNVKGRKDRRSANCDELVERGDCRGDDVWWALVNEDDEGVDGAEELMETDVPSPGRYRENQASRPRSR